MPVAWQRTFGEWYLGRRKCCARPRKLGKCGGGETCNLPVSRPDPLLQISRDLGGCAQQQGRSGDRDKKGWTYSFDVISYKHPLAIARFLIHNSPTRSLYRREPHQESPACPEGEGV